MKMKRIRIIGLLLAGLLMTACSEGEDGDDSVNYSFNPTEENGNPSPSGSELVDTIMYEGIWSIDGTPLEQRYTIAYVLDYHRGSEIVKFLTFPYQAIAEHVLTDSRVVGIMDPARSFGLLINYVGKSYSESYYDAIVGDTSDDTIPLAYNVRTEDEGTIILTLGLNYDESVLSFSKTSASCILVVPRVKLYYDDDRHRTLELSPAMKLTFVSTKRL